MHPCDFVSNQLSTQALAAAVGLHTYDADHVLRPEVGHRDAQRHLIEPHLPALRHDAHITAAAQQPWLQQLVVNADAHTGPLGLRRLTAPLHVPRCRVHMTQTLTQSRQAGDTPFWAVQLRVVHT